MQEGQLLMTQADRDRLVTLKKATKKLITQSEAGEELELSVRQVQRLLSALKESGDKGAIHGLRGKPSNRRIEERIEREAMKILSSPVYEGFGPTLAAEYLGKKHGIEASKETVRKWMIRGKLWREGKRKGGEGGSRGARGGTVGGGGEWGGSGARGVGWAGGE